MSDRELRDEAAIAHDRVMVAAWRENLLHLMTEAHLCFQMIDDGGYVRSAEGVAESLEEGVESVDRRARALVSHVIHARGLAVLQRDGSGLHGQG